MTGPVTVAELKKVFEDREYKVTMTGDTGFHVQTPNNWIISIQASPGHYCNNRDLYPHYVWDKPIPIEQLFRSYNAEIAVWSVDNPEMRQFEGWDDCVKGWVLIPEILALVDYLVEGTLSESTDKVTVDGSAPKS